MEMPGFDLFDIGGSICKFIQWMCWSFCNGACDLINEMLATISSSNMNVFTLPLGGNELNQVYSVAASVLNNVAMPIGYSFLGLLVAVELFECVKGMKAGVSRLGGSDQLIACMIKIMIVKILIDNSQALCQAVYDLTCNISRGIERYATIGGASSSMPKDSFLSLVSGSAPTDIWLFVFMILIMTVSVIVIFAAVLFVQIIALTRYLEIFICIAFAALPIIMFLNEHVKQIGIGYLKIYVAACLQGPVLVLLLKFIFPLFAAIATILGGVLVGGGSTVLQTILSAAAPLALCFAIVVMIQRSREYANGIVGGA